MSNPSPMESTVPEAARTGWNPGTWIPYALVVVGFLSATTYFALNDLSPVYTATAIVAVEGPPDATESVDDLVTAQAQVVLARDIARTVIDRLGLASDPSFAPPSKWWQRGLSILGLGRTVPETSGDPVIDAYFAGLSVGDGLVPGEIAIRFAASDPARAAAIANAVADAYVALQNSVDRDRATVVADTLAAQVAVQRVKVVDAEARLEAYRSEHPVEPATSAADIAALERELGAAAAARADASDRAVRLDTLIRSGDIAAVAAFPGATARLQNLARQLGDVDEKVAALSASVQPEEDQTRLAGLRVERDALVRQANAEAVALLAGVRADLREAAARETELADKLTMQRRAVADAENVAMLTATLEREVSAQRGILAAYVANQQATVAAGRGTTSATLHSRAQIPLEASATAAVPATIATAIVALMLCLAWAALRSIGTSRLPDFGASVEAPPLADIDVPVVGEPVTESDRGHPVREPSLVPEMTDRKADSLTAIAGEIVRSGNKCVLVTTAEGAVGQGRPLGAVAAARALARADARVVVVDLWGDGGDAHVMGVGANLPGFFDLFRGEATFAQVIFRDRRSRVHLIPAGRGVLPAGRVDREQMATVLSALTLTYDYVLLDVPADMIDVVAPCCGIALVVSEQPAAAPHTGMALARIAAQTDLRALLLVVDAARMGGHRDRRAEDVAA